MSTEHDKLKACLNGRFPMVNGFDLTNDKMIRTIDRYLAHYGPASFVNCTMPHDLDGNPKGCRFIACRFPGRHLFAYHNISDCEFDRCDLSLVSFKNATLKNTTFHECNLTNANLEGAAANRVHFSHCPSVIDAGSDHRYFKFLAIKDDDAGYMVKAGCRWFTRTHAIRHWVRKPYPSEDILCKLVDFEVIAMYRDWIGDIDPQILGFINNSMGRGKQQ